MRCILNMSNIYEHVSRVASNGKCPLVTIESLYAFRRLSLCTILASKRPVGMITPPFIIDFRATEILPKVKLVRVESVGTFLRITRLAHRKSYLVISCPNAHVKLTKIIIRSSWSWFKHCSQSLV